MNASTGSRLKILATAALFSTGGAAIKSSLLTGWQVASFRSGIAALMIILLMPTARRRWTWPAIIVGLVYAATLILFVLANKLTTAANTIFLQSTAPFYVLLLSPWLLREHMRRRDLVFMAALVFGMALFFVDIDQPVATAPDPLRGNIFAALSGAGYGLTVIGLRWLGRQEERSAGSGIMAVVSGNVLAFLICLPQALPLAESSVTDWMVVGYLGVFQVGLAYVLLTAAMPHVPALEASLFLLLEPTLNPVWAWIVHGETPGPWALAGGAVILLATLGKTFHDARRLAPEPLAARGD